MVRSPAKDPVECKGAGPLRGAPLAVGSKSVRGQAQIPARADAPSSSPSPTEAPPSSLYHVLRVVLLLVHLLPTLPGVAQDNPLPYVQREPAWDVAPQFPGGAEGLRHYLRDSLRYPEPALIDRREGTVLATIQVDARGRVTGVRIVNGVPGAPSLAREAERLLGAMPRWEPARKKKRRVPAEVQLSVPFHLPSR